MLITKTIATAGLSLMVNGIPVNASFLKGNAPACEMSASTAKNWRATGAVVVEQRVGAWCIAGKVADGYWLAEQWRKGFSTDKTSTGWLVRIPLHARSRQHANGSHSRQSLWPLEVFDAEIKTSLKYRQSFASLDDHHRKSLSATQRDALVFTRPHPDGGSYSVVIERGAKR
jgi:hypothetical protein